MLYLSKINHCRSALLLRLCQESVVKDSVLVHPRILGKSTLCYLSEIRSISTNTGKLQVDSRLFLSSPLVKLTVETPTYLFYGSTPVRASIENYCRCFKLYVISGVHNMIKHESMARVTFIPCLQCRALKLAGFSSTTPRISHIYIA